MTVPANLVLFLGIGLGVLLGIPIGLALGEVFSEWGERLVNELFLRSARKNHMRQARKGRGAAR